MQVYGVDYSVEVFLKFLRRVLHRLWINSFLLRRLEALHLILLALNNQGLAFCLPQLVLVVELALHGFFAAAPDGGASREDLSLGWRF